MKLKIDVKVEPEGDLLEELRGLSPERFLRAWAIFTKNLARNNAQKAASGSGGRSFWQREILQSIHDSVGADSATVYSDGYIAEHIHTGGVIRPKERQYLAVPVDRSVKGMYPREYAGDLVFLRKKEDGPRGRAYLAKPMKRKIKPLWILLRQVDQRPRPWWPDDAAVAAETKRFFEENF